MKISHEEQEKIRETVMAPSRDAVKKLNELEDELPGCVIASALMSTENGELSEQDALAITKWTTDFLTQAAVVAFVLAGAMDLTVRKGKVCVGIRNPDLLMQQSVKYGLAKSAAV